MQEELTNCINALAALREKVNAPKPPPPLTIENTYWASLPEIERTLPEGFRLAGILIFRIPEKDEWFLSIINRIAIRADGTEQRPRLILRKIVKPRRRLVFDILDENQPPREKEWVMTTNNVFPAMYNWTRPAKLILSDPRIEDAA